MGMTMTQKILAAHAGLDSVVAGQLIRAKLDMVLGNDITTPVAVNEFEKAGFDGIFDREKISLVMDHFTPNKDIKAAEQCMKCRTFAKRFDVEHFYDVGRMGIEHALLPEQGIVKAGGAAGKTLFNVQIVAAQFFLQQSCPALGFVEADAAVGAVSRVCAVAVGVAVSEADDVFFHGVGLLVFSSRIPCSARPSRSAPHFRQCAEMETLHFVTL